MKSEGEISAYIPLAAEDLAALRAAFEAEPPPPEVRLPIEGYTVYWGAVPTTGPWRKQWYQTVSARPVAIWYAP